MGNNAKTLFVTPTKTEPTGETVYTFEKMWRSPHSLADQFVRFKFGDAGLDANTDIRLGDLVWLLGPCGSGTTTLLYGMGLSSLQAGLRVGLVYEDEEYYTGKLKAIGKEKLFATRGGDATLCVKHICMSFAPQIVLVDCPLVREDKKPSSETIRELKRLAVEFNTAVAVTTRISRPPIAASAISVMPDSFQPMMTADTVIRLSHAVAGKGVELVKSRRTTPNYNGVVDYRQIHSAFTAGEQALTDRQKDIQVVLGTRTVTATPSDIEQMFGRTNRHG